MASPEEAKTAAIQRPSTMLLILLWLGPLALFSVPVLGQGLRRKFAGFECSKQLDPVPARTEQDGTSSSSFVLADPNSGAPKSAYSPAAVPPPIVGSAIGSTASVNAPPSQSVESQPAMAALAKESVGGSGTGGYGSFMGTANVDPLNAPMGDSPQQFAPQASITENLSVEASYQRMKRKIARGRVNPTRIRPNGTNSANTQWRPRFPCLNRLDWD